MLRLSFPSFLETCFDPVSAIVTFSVGTNFDGLWSMLRINSFGMMYFNTADAISLWSCVLTFSHNEDVTMGLEVVQSSTCTTYKEYQMDLRWSC